MNGNPLKQLSSLGQSVWLDFLQRGWLGAGGLLERLIENDALGGVTSNPSIFEKAIDGSTDYDEAIRLPSLRNQLSEELYEALTLEDVARAADLFRPRYEATHGLHGLVSIEVSPLLAQNPEATVVEARRLWKKLHRPNVMVKVPATLPGLIAIRRLLAEGININITLLFSVSRYQAVHEAYLFAMEERVARGEPVEHQASVASFFLSRIDTALDPQLETRAKELAGTIAIANAKVAYQRYLEVVQGERWKVLESRGVRPQRLLWASTGTKNPRYDDLRYVEPLIGRDTVVTMPLHTLEAYRDHGRPELRLEEESVLAQRRLDRLEELGISFGDVTDQLEQDGIRLFSEAYDKVLSTLRKKKAAVARSA